MFRIDKKNFLCRVEAGILGQDLEEQLNGHGFTCGHEPDSIEFSVFPFIINNVCIPSFRFLRWMDIDAGFRNEEKQIWQHRRFIGLRQHGYSFD